MYGITTDIGEDDEASNKILAPDDTKQINSKIR